MGKEFWQIFRDGIVKAPERDLLPIMNASRISPDAVGEELTFVEFNIFAKRLETKRTDYPHTDDCNTQDGPRRVKGYLNGLFYYDGTPSAVFTVTTKMQKSWLGVWISKQADDIWVEGEIQLLKNGWELVYQFDQPSAHDTDDNSIERGILIYPNASNLSWGFGWGSHHAIVTAKSFDESCNTAGN